MSSSRLGAECVYFLYPLSSKGVDEMDGIRSGVVRVGSYFPPDEQVREISTFHSNGGGGGGGHPPPSWPQQPSPPISLSSDDSAGAIRRFLSDLVSPICHSDDGRIAEEDVYSTYFSHINKWLPILSQTRFREKLHGGDTVTRRQPETNLLLACMYLLVRRPCKSRQSAEADKFYRGARHAYFALQGEGAGSVELAQSGLMLATYEHASGMVERAYATMWSCVGVVYGLRLKERGQVKGCSWEERVEGVEAHSLWWGVLVRDR